eukprot:CAMPEP_0197628404 /NCGR_PEP_ID=MMETSP1338-20131121/6731_1 /TAXON_ID=43686 ORGANISM="Pelagodinium beii, Strain RCC1491" /NCGR_SAMPLE_ID=MMETSP1338 /ASSEMBLY_ACC=CAM_ASM_000754 /LENGTH=255 /DNA_ID=CAMNT_0043199375 /DNA_START=49 /DNA_END=816 /DNA_ORIENTATION=-
MTQWGAVIALSQKASSNDLGAPIVVQVQSVTTHANSRKLSEGLKEMYQKCQMFDLSLLVGKTRFPAHRAVLASLSEKSRERVREAVDANTAAESQAGSTRPDLPLTSITHPEAARALIDVVYGLAPDYSVSSEEANRDVLHLAKEWDLPFLGNLAVHKLVEDINSENVVTRLATCKEFGLDAAYAEISKVLVANRDALLDVCTRDEVVSHPEILQGLLISSAEVHRPASGKHGLEEVETLGIGTEKRRKVALAGA